VEGFYEQVRGFVDGGVDVLLVETIFDTLNAKAAIYAIKKYFRDTGKPELPVMISGTITDASGRTLSGQTLEAFYTSISHAKPFSVGLKRALGSKKNEGKMWFCGVCSGILSDSSPKKYLR